MVAGKHKSNSLRKVFKRTPGGKNKVHYVKRKPTAAKCSVTGKVLAGVPRERQPKLNSMPKTRRRPERPYGGVLSSQAMRKKLIQKAREA